jgi:thioredoxin reductase
MPGILKHAELNGNGLGNAGQDGPTQPAELPVLIVGGGPTGLLSAYMLSKFGSEYKLQVARTISNSPRHSQVPAHREIP